MFSGGRIFWSSHAEMPVWQQGRDYRFPASLDFPVVTPSPSSWLQGSMGPEDTLRIHLCQLRSWRLLSCHSRFRACIHSSLQREYAELKAGFPGLAFTFAFAFSPSFDLQTSICCHCRHFSEWRKGKWRGVCVCAGWLLSTSEE